MLRNCKVEPWKYRIDGMHFPFYLIIAYSGRHKKELSQAYLQFFGDSRKRSDPRVLGLFAEWVMYEFKRPNGNTFIDSYLEDNPDMLGEKLKTQFQQISESQFFGQFEVVSVKRGVSFVVEDMFSGVTYTVFDAEGSRHVTSGIIYARLGKAGGVWSLVGANPVIINLTYAPELKSTLRKEVGETRFSVTDAYDLIRYQSPQMRKLNAGARRRKLQEWYEDKARKYQIRVPFEKIASLTRKSSSDNILIYWQQWLERGFTKEFLYKELKLFLELWDVYHGV